MIPSMEMVRELATLEPGVPVLSLHIRTDPRDPANTAATPKWLVELRNGLREVADTANEEDPRRQRLARHELRCLRWIPATGHEDKRGSSRRTAL